MPLSRQLLGSLSPLASVAGWVAASCFLIGCASAKLDYADPAHAATGYKTGKVAVAGVVQSGGKLSLSDSDRRAVANEFGRAIDKRRKGVSVIGFERVRSIAGNPRSRVGSGGNLLTSALSSSQRSKLRSAGATYALLIEVHANETWCDVSESTSTDTDEIRDKEGNVIHCITTTTYTTSSRAHRRVRARYALYELATGKSVWVVTSNHCEAHSRANCSEICFPPPPPHPDPPCVADVMKNMSSAAIRKLPRR